MQRPGIAKQCEIGREIERVEIGAAVRQAFRWNAHRIEAEDLRPGGEIGLQLLDQPLGIERGDQHRAGAALGQSVDRHGTPAEHLPAKPRNILDIDIGDLDGRDAEDLGETFGGAERIDDCGRRARGERRNQRTARRGGMRVGQRLIKRVAAAEVVKGLDAQGHGRRILHRAMPAHRAASIRVVAGPGRRRLAAAAETADGPVPKLPPARASPAHR